MSLSIEADNRFEEVPGFALRFRQGSKALASLVIILGLAVLCGWVFNLPTLTSIRPTFQSMKFNTAVLFACLGTALWMAGDDKHQHSRRILGLLVVIIAGLTLAEQTFDISLGIDQLLLRDTRSVMAYPGRMPIATAICFLLLGFAVLSLGLRKAGALHRPPLHCRHIR